MTKFLSKEEKKQHADELKRTQNELEDTKPKRRQMQGTVTHHKKELKNKSAKAAETIKAEGPMGDA